MSLAGKELFHSNLLAYAIERDPSFLALFGVADAVRARTSREHSLGKKAVIDLVVDATSASGSQSKVLIEIKLKSLPTPTQLQAYAKSAAVDKWAKAGEDIHFALVAPVKPYGGTPSPWEFVSFDRVFRELSTRYQARDDYEGKFFLDYASAFQRVMEFVGSLRLTVLDKAATTTWAELLDVAGHTDFDKRGLRIYDLLHKVIFDALADKVTVRTASAIDDSRWSGPHVHVALAPMGHAGVYEVRLKDSRSGKSYGIQVEGKHYRHFVAGVPSSGDVLPHEEAWLRSSVELNDRILDLLPLKRKSPNGKVGAPRSYLDPDGTRFSYFDADIPPQTTVQQLVLAVQEDWQKLETHIAGCVG